MSPRRQTVVAGIADRCHGAHAALPHGARGGRPTRLLLNSVWVVAAMVATVLSYLYRHDPDALSLIHAGCQRTLCVGGGLLLALLPPPWRRTRASRTLLGAGLVVGALTGPGLGDVSLLPHHWWLVALRVVGMALILAGVVVRITRHEGLTGLRSMVEVMMVACAVAAGLWQILFAWTMAPDEVTPMTFTVLILSFVLGLVALTWLRDRESGLLLAAVGAAGFVAARLSALQAVTSGGHVSWQAVAASCAGSALAIVGLFHTGPYVPFAGSARQAVVESRSVVSLATITLVATLALVYLLAVAPERMQTPMWVYYGLFVTAGWLWEVIRARQSRDMVVGLARAVARDPLTGLPNLRGLEDAVADIVHRGPSRRDGRLSAMTVDVNRFKDVNDLAGHASADELLRAIARLLTDLTRHLDARVFRTAGNEFLVLAHCRPDQIHRVGQLLREDLPVVAGRIPNLARMPLSVTTGLAHRHDGTDLTESAVRLLCSRSTQAMRQAKQSGRHVGVYDTHLAAQQRRDWQIEAVLRERLTAGEQSAVAVHFQPVICLHDGRLASVEALARWSDPRLDGVAPSEFIAVAERTGLIDRLGLQIMRDALLGAGRAGLLDAGKAVAVNVSPIQLRRPHFVADVRDLLNETGVNPGQLTIEVTESVFMSADDPAVRTLSALHREGVAVVLDDFGTGYSSLSYLTRLPVKGLKIDRSITIDLANAKTHAIASSIAQMAGQLDLEIVVEGVEDARQEDQVLGLGLDRVQGWHYSRAVNEEALAALVNLTHLGAQVMDVRPYDNVTRPA